MHGCRYWKTIFLGIAFAGCSPQPTEGPVGSGQSTGGATEVTEGGFVGGRVGGDGFSGGGMARGGGGFGGAAPQWNEVFEGAIAGDYVLQPSGKYIESYGGKGGAPLVIQLESGRLPLMPRTDEIGEQLLKLSGSRVRLRGRTFTTTSSGRRDLGGQQGYRHGIPDHAVYFLTVDSVEAL